ncbi:MAG: signal peptidase II [Anaerolineae bacterium]
MKTNRKILLILIILCVCVTGDQVTKAIAKQHLAGVPTIYMLGGTVMLRYSENVGAFLSLGARLPETARVWIFIVFNSLVLAGTLIFTLKMHSLSVWGVIAGALIVSGGFSNLIDRLFHNGAVVDFLNIGIGKVRTGIFNLADVAIMAGIGLLLIEAWRREETHNINVASPNEKKR